MVGPPIRAVALDMANGMQLDAPQSAWPFLFDSYTPGVPSTQAL
jgi:hypothetical protein